MGLSVVCTRCGKQWGLRDDARGRRVPCPQCGGELPLGTPNDMADDDLDAVEFAAEPPPPETPPSPAPVAPVAVEAPPPAAVPMPPAEEALDEPLTLDIPSPAPAPEPEPEPPPLVVPLDADDDPLRLMD